MSMFPILVIDDEPEFLGLLKEALSAAGYDVVAAANGREGLEAFKRWRFPVVVTDIIMPDKEGLETILELRQLNPKVKIIAISGGGRSGRGADILRHAALCGATETMAKPLVLKDLVAAVGRLLPSAS